MARRHDTLYFARQPITDRRDRVVAYEVLFRADGRASVADFVDGLTATRSVLSALDRYGHELFEGCPAFVNLPRAALVDRLVADLDPARIGCEVLEDVPSDPEVVEAVAELRAAGFTISLDDFGPSTWPGLVAHADIVKLDIRQYDAAGLAAAVGSLHARGVEVLAEKVEHPREWAACRAAGFDLFQGYAVGRPVTFPLPAVVAWPARMWRGAPVPGRGPVAEPLTP